MSICAGADAGDCGVVSTLNISFKRPNPEAIILGDDNLGNNYANIVISSADESATRSIIVTKVGQIYVKNN